MDRTVDNVGRPYYPGYGPFAEDYRVEPRIEMDLDRTYCPNIIQWNLSIADILGPDIFGNFLLQYRGFPLSEVKNVLVTRFETKIFVFIMEVFSIVSLIRRVC